MKQTAPLSQNLALYLNIFLAIVNIMKWLVDKKINHYDIKCDNYLIEPLVDNCCDVCSLLFLSFPSLSSFSLSLDLSLTKKKIRRMFGFKNQTPLILLFPLPISGNQKSTKQNWRFFSFPVPLPSSLSLNPLFPPRGTLSEIEEQSTTKAQKC